MAVDADLHADQEELLGVRPSFGNHNKDYARKAFERSLELLENVENGVRVNL